MRHSCQACARILTDLTGSLYFLLPICHKISHSRDEFQRELVLRRGVLVSGLQEAHDRIRHSYSFLQKKAL